MTTKFRTLVEFIEGAPPISVGGNEYSAVDLARMVSIQPGQVWPAQLETPQLIAELGRLTAMAYRAKAAAETAYRVWRDGLIWSLTNDVSAAIIAGFGCAAHPGVDAKGKAKPAKCPSTAQAEAFARQCPEYSTHYDAMAEAEEAWATIHSTLEAARQRLWAIRGDRTDDNMRTQVEQAEPAAHIDIQDRRKGPPPPPRRG